MPRRSLFLFFVGLFLLNSCKKVETSHSPLVQTVAILPFDTESNDINAPDILQKLTYRAMKNSVYQVSDIEQVNKKLEAVGIVDGGQLAALDPVKLGRDLGVQALLYGNVESFGYTNVGFYSQRKVTLELKMVEVATGQSLWESIGTGVTRKVALDPEEAKRNFTTGLIQQLADKATKSPLEEEARLATLRALAGLPGFVFRGFDGDPSGHHPLKSGHQFMKGLIKER